ncbi:MAG: hypothetical protein ACRYFK_13600 [Janthinobacterium lividum]
MLIQEDAELRLLRVCWVGGRSTSAFREAASGLVDLVQQHGTHRLLLELNEQPDVPVYDQLWLSTTLLPRIAQLPVTQLVIILSSQRVYNRHVLESLLMQYQARIRADIQFFAQSEAALDWLTDNSPRVPALLAEWAREVHPGSSSPVSQQRR